MELLNFGIEGLTFKNTEHGRQRFLGGAEIRRHGVLTADYDIISGVKPLDYFDTYTEEFKAAGGEVAGKSVQAAYEEQLAAVK